MRELRRSRFLDDPIRTYLVSFYGTQGKADLSALAGASYVLDGCQDCSLVYQREIPNDRLLYRLYEEWIDPELALKQYWSSRSHDHVLRLRQSVRRVLGTFGSTTDGLKLLDFGAGWGAWCMAARSFCQVTAAELSPTRQEYLKENGIRLLSDCDSPYQFDWIHTEQVFEHLARPAEQLSELVSWIRPGGLVSLSVPNGRTVRERIQQWDWQASKGSANSLNMVAPLEHLNCFNFQSLCTLAERSGLRLVESLSQPPGVLMRWARRIKSLARGRDLGTNLYFRKPA